MSMQSIDVVKEYSRSSAERLLAVDDRLLYVWQLMIDCCIVQVSKNSNDCIKYSKTSINFNINKKYGIHINKKVTH